MGCLCSRKPSCEIYGVFRELRISQSERIPGLLACVPGLGPDDLLQMRQQDWEWGDMMVRSCRRTGKKGSIQGLLGNPLETVVELVTD